MGQLSPQPTIPLSVNVRISHENGIATRCLCDWGECLVLNREITEIARSRGSEITTQVDCGLMVSGRETPRGLRGNRGQSLSSRPFFPGLKKLKINFFSDRPGGGS